MTYHPTAIRRNGPSAPLRHLATYAPDVLVGRVLDYGCGRGDFGCEFLVVCSCEPDVPLLSALVQAGQSLAEQSWVVAILSTRDIRAMIGNIEAANSHIAPTVPMISPLSDELH